MRLSSDLVEDTGRMDSERQMRNKPSGRWLDDVAQQAEGDCEEVMESISEQKKAMDQKHNTFLPALETGLSAESGTNESDRKRQVQELLANADTMLELYRRADSTITHAFGGEGSVTTVQKNFKADAQTVKDVLAVGKRICDGELESVEQQARARELLGRKEVFEQAKGIFGQPKRAEGGEVGRTLEYVERGVKRMVRGME